MDVMPIYEYRCQDCGTKFEKLVRNQEAPKECPSCGKERLTQEFSTFASHIANAPSLPSPDSYPCSGGGGRCPGSCPGMSSN